EGQLPGQDGQGQQQRSGSLAPYFVCEPCELLLKKCREHPARLCLRSNQYSRSLDSLVAADRCTPSPSNGIASIDSRRGRSSIMPEKETLARAMKDKEEGKSPSTQAGEFVREEMHHVREGKHGARSTKQAIAIGLSKARRSGVRLAAPRKGRAAAEVKRKAQL